MNVLDLKQIKYFLNLADTLNFTRAAQLSNVSQPALTKAIQRLEDELGGALVHRDGKDTRLTELGRTIRGDFETIVSSEMRARELADLVSREARTMISIGVTSTMGPEPIWPFLEGFLNIESGTEALITSIDPGKAGELVLSGALDACFCRDIPMDNPKLQSIPLYRERLMLAVGQDHRFAGLDIVPMKALREEVYIDRINCEFRGAVVEHFMDQDVLMRPLIQSDREDWVQSAIGRGFGVAMAPEHARLNANVVLRPVSGLDLSRRVDLITVFGSATSPAIRRLREAAKIYDWPASKV